MLFCMEITNGSSVGIGAGVGVGKLVAVVVIIGMLVSEGLGVASRVSCRSGGVSVATCDPLEHPDIITMKSMPSLIK